MITGGHGGTKFEELIAPVIGFVVNTVCYMLLFAVVLSIFSRRRVR